MLTGSPTAQFSFNFWASASGKVGVMPPSGRTETMLGPLFPGSPNMTRATILEYSAVSILGDAKCITSAPWEYLVHF